jgi:hypothetical protein
MIVVLISTSVLFINKMIKIKKEANRRDRIQVIKIGSIVTFISAGVAMNCLTLFISLISEFYEGVSALVVLSLVMRAISIFFLCLFLMFLFSPFEQIRNKIKDNIDKK